MSIRLHWTSIAEPYGYWTFIGGKWHISVSSINVYYVCHVMIDLYPPVYPNDAAHIERCCSQFYIPIDHELEACEVPSPNSSTTDISLPDALLEQFSNDAVEDSDVGSSGSSNYTGNLTVHPRRVRAPTWPWRTDGTVLSRNLSCYSLKTEGLHLKLDFCSSTRANRQVH